MYTFIFSSHTKRNFYIIKSWTRVILQEGFRVDVILVPSEETLRKKGYSLCDCLMRGTLKYVFNTLFWLVWFWTPYFAICHHLGVSNCTESGLIYYQKMNAFLHKPYIDYSLLVSSSHSSQIKDIVGKTKIFFLFYLIPFGIFIELELKIFLYVNLKPGYSYTYRFNSFWWF